MKEEKAVVYKTDRNYFYNDFQKAKWLILLFGYGLFERKRLEKKLDSMQYRVYNTKITSGRPGDANYLEIPFNELKSVQLKQSVEHKNHNIADLIFESETGIIIEFLGLKEAKELESVFALVIEKENKRRKLAQKAKGEYENIQPGGLEELNNLVGMWQQGMISDEDYYREEAKLRKK
ncbi:MAG: hypothetical protein LAT67_12660 [Balneolales bacterium]|nr:hypothetical protein [Balneolales bacterium]